MEDDNSMSERILRTIETIFSNDTELEEFVIIPSVVNVRNKSPVLYEAHNIGLESWCVKHVYRYAYLELMESRTRKKGNRRRNVNHLLTGALLINPDVSTFWNMKRQLIEDDVLSIASELTFAKVVLSYKSKSNEAFAYRRFLIKKILDKSRESERILPLLRNEMFVCTQAAMRNANNYHAWTHRIWCFETLAAHIDDYQNFLLEQIEFSENWVCSHVSEHTGFHYRQYLFDCVRKNNNVKTVFDVHYRNATNSLKLIGENGERSLISFLLGREKNNLSTEESNRKVNHFSLLITDLFSTLNQLHQTYPGHESIYYHRRYLLYKLVQASHEYLDLNFQPLVSVKDDNLCGRNIVNEICGGASEPKLFKSQPNKFTATFLYKTLSKHESDFIREDRREISDMDLLRRYEKWLKFILPDL